MKRQPRGLVWPAACLCAILAWAMVAAPQGAADYATAGRAVLEKWQQAVVTARLVIGTRMVVGGREVQRMDNTSETPATIIDPSGLAVLSLSSTNPGETMERLMPRMGGDNEPSFKMETKVSDVKLRLASGQELAAQMVLQDKDLDLAFVRPKEKVATPLVALDLSSESKPDVLDQVVILSRLGKVGGWAPAATIDHLRAIISKPRTFYVPGSLYAAVETGTAAFSLDGKIVGILLLRVVPPDGSVMMSFSTTTTSFGMLPVIVPAADIREIARQVPQM